MNDTVWIVHTLGVDHALTVYQFPTKDGAMEFMERIEADFPTVKQISVYESRSIAGFIRKEKE